MKCVWLLTVACECRVVATCYVIVAGSCVALCEWQVVVTCWWQVVLAFECKVVVTCDRHVLMAYMWEVKKTLVMRGMESNLTMPIISMKRELVQLKRMLEINKNVSHV